MRVTELYSPHVHSVCYSLHVAAGSLTDSLNRPGVALLTQRMALEAEMLDFSRRSPAGRICNGGVAPGEAFVLVHGHRLHGSQIASLVPSFLTEARFEAEVLERERAMLWDTIPDSAAGTVEVGELINRLLIRPDLNWSVYGGRDAVSRVALEDIADRFEECWQDGNLVLSVAGAYERSDLERCVEELRNALPSQPAGPPGPMADILTDQRVMAVVPVPDERFSLHLLFPCCSVGSAEAPLIQILDCIVGDGPDSRVRQRLSWDSGLAESAGSQPWVLGDSIILEVSVEGAASRLPEILKLFVRSVESLLIEPPEKEEVHEARTVLRFLRDFQLDDPQSAAPARGSQFFASRLENSEELDRLTLGPERVSPDDIHEVAGRVLNWDNLSVLYIGPESTEIEELLEETWPNLPIELWDAEPDE
jgi:predicted Zn-dependent peptidase